MSAVRLVVVAQGGASVAGVCVVPQVPLGQISAALSDN